MIRFRFPLPQLTRARFSDRPGMALELYNTVECNPCSRGLTIDISGEGAAELPRDEYNLVDQAVQHVFRQVGYSPAGLKIRLFNQIPIARGLGSSTSAIVGGYRGKPPIRWKAIPEGYNQFVHHHRGTPRQCGSSRPGRHCGVGSGGR